MRVFDYLPMEKPVRMYSKLYLVPGVGAVGAMAFESEIVFGILGVNVLNGDSALDAAKSKTRGIVFLVIEKLFLLLLLPGVGIQDLVHLVLHSLRVGLLGCSIPSRGSDGEQ